MQRLHRYLTRVGEWNENAENRLRAECSAQIERSVEEYLGTKAQLPESIIDYLHESLPDSLVDQRDAIVQKARGIA